MADHFIARDYNGAEIGRHAIERRTTGGFSKYLDGVIAESEFGEFYQDNFTVAELTGSGSAIGPAAVASKRIGLRYAYFATLCSMGSSLGFNLDVNLNPAASPGLGGTTLLTKTLNYDLDPTVVPLSDEQFIVSANSAEAVDAKSVESVSNAGTTTVTPASAFTELFVTAETAGQFSFAFGTATPPDPSTGGAGAYCFHLEAGQRLRFISAYPLSAFKCRAAQGSAAISWTAIDRRKKISGSGVVSAVYAEAEFDFPNILWLDRDNDRWSIWSLNLPATAADLDNAGGLVMRAVFVTEK